MQSEAQSHVLKGESGPKEQLVSSGSETSRKSKAFWRRTGLPSLRCEMQEKLPTSVYFLICKVIPAPA